MIAVQKNAVNKLKTGEYELAPGLTLPEILALFVQGKTKQYAITFPEGWSFKEILQEIEKNPNLEHTLHNVDFEALMSQLGIDIKQSALRSLPPVLLYHLHPCSRLRVCFFLTPIFLKSIPLMLLY